MLDEPEGDVEVRTSQGPIHLSSSTNDRRQQLAVLGEPQVVLQELPLASLSSVHHTDANSRPGPVVPLELEALQDREVNVFHVRRSSKPVEGRHKDQTGHDLLGLRVQALLGQGGLHTSCKFLELALVCVFSRINLLAPTKGH